MIGQIHAPASLNPEKEPLAPTAYVTDVQRTASLRTISVSLTVLKPGRKCAIGHVEK
jgi:hypothetical protein